MILKVFLYFVAAIFLGLCVYAFVEGVTVVTVENPLAVELDSNEAEGALKVIDGKVTAPCEEESFWAKYNVWGDIGSVYTPTDSDEAVSKKVDESISCDEPSALNK